MNPFTYSLLQGKPLALCSLRGAQLAALATVLVLGGCSTQRLDQPAPVEERTVVRPAVVKIPLGAENAGKPGYYTVRPGDNLHRIALDNGHSWRDLQAWNNLTNPDLLDVGQVLRVVPPVLVSAPEAVAAVPLPAPVPVPAPVSAEPAAAAAAPGAVAPLVAAPAAVASPAVVARPLAPAGAAAVAEAPGTAISLVWPAPGAVISTFDEAKNKGISIAGRMGDPVLAAADGRVVYAGAGLRGYGNLIILKHNNTYLTAYAHNQALLVREDQAVKQGQRIAEMGSSDSDRVKLHFEVRRQGKPVDPLNHLPKR
jgi:lipoprotein NlpD